MATETKVEQYIDIDGLRQLLNLIKNTYVCQKGLTSKVREQVREILDETGYDANFYDVSTSNREPNKIIASDSKLSDVIFKNGDILYARDPEDGSYIVFINHLSRWLEISSSQIDTVKFEIEKRSDIKVNYTDSEIRVNTQTINLSLQDVGEKGDPNNYYISCKAYAPKGTVRFKETLDAVNNGITDHLYYDFSENNKFAGVDKFGRKYSIFWLPVANYSNNKWTKYGDNSTSEKCVGWYYSVEWYDTNYKILGSDTIRIVLTNDACHHSLVPDVVIRKINEKLENISITGGTASIATYNTPGIVTPNDEDFTIDNSGTRKGLLSLKPIAIRKVTGLQEALDTKADKERVYTKAEINSMLMASKSAADIAEISANNESDLNNMLLGNPNIPVGTLANTVTGSTVTGTYILIEENGTLKWNKIESHDESIGDRISALEEKQDDSGSWDTF